MSNLLRDNRILLYLFISFRLLLLLIHSPAKDYTPGLSAFGDFPYFYDLARTAEQGKLPYRDYWFEYPPLIALLSQGVYTLSSLRGGDYTAYAVLLAFTLTMFDVGNLILVRRIGTQLHGETVGIGLAWIYSLMVAPLVITYWTFDAVVAFFLLLALYWTFAEKDDRSAVAAGLGALTKLMPLVVMAAVLRIKGRTRYVVIAMGLTIIGFAAMIGVAGQFAVPSLVIQFNKTSSQTVWALIDGNYRTGILNPDHSRPETAFALQGNTARIPSWIRLSVFGLIWLYFFMTFKRRDAKGLAAFTGITIAILFLWSQNWSPQWQIVLIPLILLNFPTRNGVLLCLALAFISFAEYPLIISRVGTEVPETVKPVLAMLILARTVLLIGFGLTLYIKYRTVLPTSGATTHAA